MTEESNARFLIGQCLKSLDHALLKIDEDPEAAKVLIRLGRSVLQQLADYLGVSGQ